MEQLSGAARVRGMLRIAGLGAGMVELVADSIELALTEALPIRGDRLRVIEGTLRDAGIRAVGLAHDIEEALL